MNRTSHLHCLDGKFHAMAKALPKIGGQYCYYTWKNDMNDKQRGDVGHMECN